LRIVILRLNLVEQGTGIFLHIAEKAT